MPMTQGAPDSPVRGTTGHEFYETMSDTNRARGEKRGVLGTDRAQKLDKTKDADADAADDDEQNEG